MSRRPAVLLAVIAAALAAQATPAAAQTALVASPFKTPWAQGPGFSAVGNSDMVMLMKSAGRYVAWDTGERVEVRGPNGVSRSFPVGGAGLVSLSTKEVTYLRCPDSDTDVCPLMRAGLPSGAPARVRGASKMPSGTVAYYDGTVIFGRRNRVYRIKKGSTRARPLGRRLPGNPYAIQTDGRTIAVAYDIKGADANSRVAAGRIGGRLTTLAETTNGATSQSEGIEDFRIDGKYVYYQARTIVDEGEPLTVAKRFPIKPGGSVGAAGKNFKPLEAPVAAVQQAGGDTSFAALGSRCARPTVFNLGLDPKSPYAPDEGGAEQDSCLIAQVAGKKPADQLAPKIEIQPIVAEVVTKPAVAKNDDPTVSYTVTGRFTAADGTPIGGAVLAARRHYDAKGSKDFWQQVGETTTAADGTFTVTAEARTSAFLGISTEDGPIVWSAVETDLPTPAP